MASELDTKVAEVVMGWTRVDDLHYRDANGQYMTDGSTFSPSTDWGDAGLVVEKMRQQGRDFVMESNGGEWWAQFAGTEPFLSGHSDGDTAPLAICRAALAALGKEG